MTKLSAKQKLVIYALSAVVIILLSAAFWIISQSKLPRNLAEQPDVQRFHYAYFMQKNFYTGILNPAEAEPIAEKVYGGIVSHHFFVEREIAKLFSLWRGQKIRTVVILGPNHFSAGKADVFVSRQGYRTPWGELGVDAEFIEQLIANGAAENEEAPFEREHSISVEAGFIKYYFPQARIVPVIIKHNVSKTKIQKLAQNLISLLPEDSIVLASVDFSHHVANQTARLQDKKSIALLQKFDADGIWKLPPNQMDSPAAIYGLLKYLEYKQAKKMRYWNTNQAIISGNLSSADVTSYVFASFTK